MEGHILYLCIWFCGTKCCVLLLAQGRSDIFIRHWSHKIGQGDNRINRSLKRRIFPKEPRKHKEASLLLLNQNAANLKDFT